MANETKTENVMLTGQTAYFKKSGSMVKRGTLNIPNALTSRSYAEGYIGPNSILHGTDLATTSEYKSCETLMRNYMEDDWEETEGERTIYTNATKIQTMLAPEAANIQSLTDAIDYSGEELTYIRGTGTQWIDTKYIPTAETNFKFKISSVTTGEYAIMGQNNWNVNSRLVTSQNSALLWYYASSNKTITTRYSATNEIELYNNYIKCNGTVVSSSTSKNANVEKNTSIKLWCNGQGQHIGRFYLYYFQIYEGTTLTMDLVPYRDFFGKVCLYDKISKKCLYNGNAATVFTAGAVKNVMYKSELEYIETSGTNYIALGTASSSTATINANGFELDFMPLSEFTSPEVEEKYILSGATSTTQSAWWLHLCDVAPHKNGSISFDAGVTTHDAKLSYGQRQIIRFKQNIATLPDGSQITLQEFNNPTYWRIGQTRSVTTKNYAKVRVYGIKLYRGSELVLDCIPVKNASGVAKLYDKINKVYMYNSGTLKAGPEKKGE